ncbi:MAG: crossover junction endodeoxyribonuclease RuvC [Armatimonadetes bacterium]|nr:crossover junction endodeoxyribonuclease RuvC [Armatimonadota bacterium]
MVIFGIDPGTATTGYGVLRKEGERLEVVAYGAILTSPRKTPPERLRDCYEAVCALLDTHQPDILITERLFFKNNETTAFSVGRTVGVTLLAAAQKGIPWVEYTPLQIKQAVVGYGNAEKKQVQFMVTQILKLASTPKPDDVADALAICICHAHWSRYNEMVNRNGTCRPGRE